MYRVLPPFGGDQRAVAEVVNGIMNGKTNNTGFVTLATGGATTTTITDARIGVDSVILLMPSAGQSATMEFPYGMFQDTTDQSVASTTTAYAMSLNTIDFADGVSLVSGTRLTAGYSGLYNFQFSSQFDNADTQIQDVSVWFRKNGTDIASSNSEFSVPNSHGGVNGRLIAALNIFVPLAKNDYIEIYWRASSTLVTMQTIPAQTSPTRPVTPSLIATMSYISSNGYTTNLFTEPYISSVTNGSAVISHPANSIAGKTFKYIVVG